MTATTELTGIDRHNAAVAASKTCTCGHFLNWHTYRSGGFEIPSKKGCGFGLYGGGNGCPCAKFAKAV